MDSATWHVIPDILFRSINILFLWQRSTYVLQPLDIGIITLYKSKYRSRFIRNLLQQVRQMNLALPKLNIFGSNRFHRLVMKVELILISQSQFIVQKHWWQLKYAQGIQKTDQRLNDGKEERLDSTIWNWKAEAQGPSDNES